jgi:hypothetical protein
MGRADRLRAHQVPHPAYRSGYIQLSVQFSLCPRNGGDDWGLRASIPNPNGDSNLYSDSDSDCYSHSDIYSDANTNIDSNSNSNRAPDAHSNSNANLSCALCRDGDIWRYGYSLHD